MSRQITRKPGALPAPRLRRRNYMIFPAELRNAIPDLPTYVGRALELTTTQGNASNTKLFGTCVHLLLELRETGKLKGRFTVRMDLEVEAARAMAESLLELAYRAEKMPQSPIPPVQVYRGKRK